ncbi:hypothetical protein OMP43_03795 [Sphingomonas sp. CBMAI 2297]|uniref:hypothetical protein n=1 Tax=Sphingomonas sp. CBMAI 2297 TaxID=2991720 RepID=UPI002456163B|nr:hypothetical protein [Sphingomonas sp. CBMAI 2297]MDH4743138.1 hypothetical protein [Sphingomonas sp. CBMAI 2297]
MSVEHTPGPWSTANDDGGNGLLSVTMGHDKAWMHFNPSVSSFGYDPTEEMRANARLIAAAPELLEALENAEVLCTACVARDRTETKRRPHSTGAKEILARSEACLATVRAAIAKARGEA